MLLVERIKRANQIYDSQLKEKLEKDHKGKIVAIEIISGDFFLGGNEIEAYEKGIKKYPDKTFVYKRIGYKATHFVGSIYSGVQSLYGLHPELSGQRIKALHSFVLCLT